MSSARVGSFVQASQRVSFSYLMSTLARPTFPL